MNISKLFYSSLNYTIQTILLSLFDYFYVAEYLVIFRCVWSTCIVYTVSIWELYFFVSHPFMLTSFRLRLGQDLVTEGFSMSFLALTGAGGSVTSMVVQHFNWLMLHAWQGMQYSVACRAVCVWRFSLSWYFDMSIFVLSY